ncbi:Fatty acid hydroperoxide lyase chloroplastic, partial [Bienertia sinuspersici]
NLDTLWDTIEQSLTKDDKVNLLGPLQKFIFNFLAQGMLGAKPANYSQELAETGHVMIDKWLAVQLLPILNIGLFQPLEEIFLHSFAYPFFLVKGDYNKLANFIGKEARELVQRGKTEYGLSEQETIHNLLFILGFNAFGGFSVFLPSLLKNLGSNKGGIQETLRNEVREKCKSRSLLSFSAIQDMPNVQSFVYETLRLKPPVPLQYGRARKDFVLHSHESRFEIKKGELLCGYQSLVMRDPNIFEEPENFVPDRFMGDKGGELLNYLYWSNGPQTGKADASNKQCAARDYVPSTACLFLADLFLRYDSITQDSYGAITGVQKAA